MSAYSDTIIRLIILSLSMMGYLCLLSRHLKPEFSIGVLLTSIGSITFIGGILTILPETVYAVIAGGLVCLVLCFRHRISIKTVFTPGVIGFFILCGIILYFVYGAVFTELDNFTHWASICKVLIRNDRFPLYFDPNVFFPSYPLGSASFIYFFCEALSADSEWLQMFAQNMLSAGMLVSLFAFAKNNLHRITAFICSIFMFCCYIGFRELLVDNLLGIVGFGGIAFCIYYKDQLRDKIWFTVPYMVMLMSIKNSGLLFAVYIILFCLVFIDKNKISLMRFALCSSSVFMALFLWKLHVRIRFENAATSKYNMTLENFRYIFGDKTPDDINFILKGFIREVFASSNHIVYALVFFGAVILINRFVFKKSNRLFNQLALLTVAVYISYVIGMLAMYLFTMPTNEALMIACYERYHRTILVYLGGIVCIAAMNLDLPDKLTGSAANILVCAICLAVMFGTIDPYFSNLSRQTISEKHPRIALENIISQYNLAENEGYLIVIDDDYFPTDPLEFAGYYLLGSPVKTKTISQIKENPELFDKHPNIIVYSQTESVDEYLESIFGDNLPRVFHAPDYFPVQ
ncbi:MAG: hypothetical protein IJN27_02475 [Oscillospiraceae bacterium]|nr:hypothetical protein [Oscillospiraceae bacterium]